MNAPGSPSSPLQMMYFGSPAACADPRPLDPRGKPGPAAAAQAAGRHLLDQVAPAIAPPGIAAGPGSRRAGGTRRGRSGRSRRSTRWPAAAAAEERADRRIADVDRMANQRIVDLVGQQPVQNPPRRAGRSAARAPGAGSGPARSPARPPRPPWRKASRAPGRARSPPAASGGTCPRSPPA